MKLQKIGLMCGIFAPVLWLTLISLSNAMRPEFSLITHYISELGETGSSTEKLMRYAGFELTGLLYLLFAVALWTRFTNFWLKSMAIFVALDGLGRLGAGIFPCDPGCIGLSIKQHLHHDFATVGFLSGVSSAICCGIAFHQLQLPRYLSGYAFGSGLIALLLLALMSWNENPLGASGLYEHLATLLLSIWLLVFAIYLQREHARRFAQ